MCDIAAENCKHQQEERKFYGGLMDIIRVNCRQRYKRALCPHPYQSWKPKVVEGGGGFCLETPFTPGNWTLPAEGISVAGAYGLAASAEEGSTVDGFTVRCIFFLHA